MCVDNLEISIPDEEEEIESSKPAAATTTTTEMVTDDTTMMTDEIQSNFEIDIADVHAHTEDIAITPQKETMMLQMPKRQKRYRQHYLNSQSI